MEAVGAKVNHLEHAASARFTKFPKIIFRSILPTSCDITKPAHSFEITLELLAPTGFPIIILLVCSCILRVFEKLRVIKSKLFFKIESQWYRSSHFCMYVFISRSFQKIYFSTYFTLFILRPIIYLDVYAI